MIIFLLFILVLMTLAEVSLIKVCLCMEAAPEGMSWIMLLQLHLKLEKHCLKKHHDGVEASFYPSAQLKQPLTKIQSSALKTGKMLALLFWVTRTVLLYKIFLTVHKKKVCGCSKEIKRFILLRYIQFNNNNKKTFIIWYDMSGGIWRYHTNFQHLYVYRYPVKSSGHWC